MLWFVWFARWRNIVLNNFELGSNFIKFQENSCKTFHGGVSDLKYIPRTVKHICHEEGVKHEPCLVEIYCFYRLSGSLCKEW